MAIRIPPRRRGAVGVSLAAVALLLSLVSCKHEKEETTSAADSSVGAVEVMTATATGTVQAIDPTKRTVTLRSADGTSTYKCGKDVINFDQIKVGDTVKATVVE